MRHYPFPLRSATRGKCKGLQQRDRFGKRPRLQWQLLLRVDANQNVLQFTAFRSLSKHILAPQLHADLRLYYEISSYNDFFRVVVRRRRSINFSPNCYNSVHDCWKRTELYCQGFILLWDIVSSVWQFKSASQSQNI